MKPVAVAREIDADRAWSLLLALRHRGKECPGAATDVSVEETKETLVAREASSGAVLLGIDPTGTWRSDREVSEDGATLFALHAPLCRAGPRQGITIGHLGQSLDGFIATASGHSHYVNGEENVRHLHRLRALADAVVVGAGTVTLDDPQLTVRHVEGPSPARIVLDPTRRLKPDQRVFTDKGPATYVVCAPHADRSKDTANLIEIDTDDGVVSPRDITAALHAHGFHLALIEGGGVTVSRFLDAGALDRLQLAVAPLLIGGGRPGITRRAAGTLDEALRLSARRFPMGDDVLFDCDLRAP